tara:strand:+ start:119 stop:1294 length:1176 start_codon:yes stop_codon:yes gene_type:complete
MNTYQLSSIINPVKLALVVIIFLSFGHFPRGTSFFYFFPSIILLSLIVLNKYAFRNKYIIIAFLISAFIPIPSMALGIDIARDLTFLLYFFAATLLGYTLVRYMPLEYFIYGLYLAGAYVTFNVIFRLIIGFNGDFSLLAIRDITGGAGDLGIVFIVMSFYGIRYFPLLITFIGSMLLMFVTQSRTMLISFLIWSYFYISIRSGVFFNWIMRFSVIAFVSGLVILGVSADSESYTFVGKILRSIQEIIPDENQNLHSNWRAVESAVALNSFISGSYFEMLFGKGLGFRLPLGFEMTLANVEFESIPILHNGYLYILLKYGIFGLLLWYKFISSLVVKEGDPILVSISKSCFYIILITQLVSGGVLQYQGLIFLSIMAACASLNYKNARNYS